MARLYLGNLPPDVDDGDIEDFFKVAAGYAAKDIQIIRDLQTGNCRGFGFTNINGDADEIIRKTNHLKIRDRIIYVKVARPMGDSSEKGKSQSSGKDRR